MTTKPSPEQSKSETDLLRVVQALKTLRTLPMDKSEYQLRQEISRVLAVYRIEHRVEVQLGAGARIDILTQDGVGIEIKRAKPERAKLTEQVHRYLAFEAVQSIVMVMGRNTMWNPLSINGKPVRCINLTSLLGTSI